MIPINKANNNPSHNSNHLKFSDTKKKKKRSLNQITQKTPTHKHKQRRNYTDTKINKQNGETPFHFKLDP